MRGRGIFIAVVLLLAAFMANMAGCSRFSQPSDAEVIKAIEDSGLLKSTSF